MYLEHFGLREYPFSLTPDTAFFFEYGHYREALNTMLVALRSGEGFIKVTGEVGTGKTLLCRKLLNTLEADPQFRTAYVPNPYLTPTALNLSVADELGLELGRDASQHRIMKALAERMVALGEQGIQVVLCIDEAQAMPTASLEALRLLTNLETEKRKLLHVVLFGQPELDQKLAEHGARQIRQRISFSHWLEPIDPRGLEAYVAHRLLVAGSAGGVAFSRAAIGELFRASRGIPRLVNILAHKSLMACYGEGKQEIGRSHVRRAARDTDDVLPRRRPRWKVYAFMVSLILGLFATAYAFELFPGGPIP